MGFNINKVLIGGNLTRDPELRYLQSGTAMVKFGLAINESWGKGDDRKEKTVFVNIVAFGHTAEAIDKYFKKGQPIMLTDAKLDFSEWEDKVTGDKRTALAVKCEGFQFVDFDGSKKTNPTGESIGASGLRNESKPDYDDIPF